jgi:hypothetical protein
MAIDILSIPPLSDKIEGVFSGVRRAIPWERGSLDMETVQIQELLGNWNKNGLLHEDEYVNELLIKATALVEKAEERQNSKPWPILYIRQHCSHEARFLSQGSVLIHIPQQDMM